MILRRAILLLLLMSLCRLLFANDSAANVTGTWSVTACDGGRTVTQALLIQQEGEKISGTFKGPRQTGTLEGSVKGNVISFHVKARIPLDYTGTVSGEAMKGSLTGRGKNGDWSATRSQETSK